MDNGDICIRQVSEAVRLLAMNMSEHLAMLRHPGVRSLRYALAKQKIVTVYDLLYFVGHNGRASVGGSLKARAALNTLLARISRDLRSEVQVEGFESKAATLWGVPIVIGWLANHYAIKHAASSAAQAESVGKREGAAAGLAEGKAQGLEEGVAKGRRLRTYNFTVLGPLDLTPEALAIRAVKAMAYQVDHFALMLRVEEEFSLKLTLCAKWEIKIPIAPLIWLVNRYIETEAPVTITCELLINDEAFPSAKLTLDFKGKTGTLELS